MFLLLSDSHDPCCQSVRAFLEARHYPTLTLSNPLMHPSCFVWRLDNEQSASEFALNGEPPIHNSQISGVLVRRTGWIDPSGWQPHDLAYMQAEIQAALLSWLWSLPCPVVNRYPPVTWYRPKAPLLSWYPLLRRCGLPTLETLVTNVEQEAHAFGQSLTTAGAPSAVYGPLTSDARYLVTDGRDWSGLAAMQQRTPVCLTYPHGTVQFVCVASEKVVWEGEMSRQMLQLEPALVRFAGAAGLNFVEFAFASTANGLCVIAVEPYPQFEHFGDAARQQITEGIVQILTAKLGNTY